MTRHRIPASGIAAMALSGRSSVPPNLALEDARRVCAQAAGSADVNRYAQAELARSREALARADRAWADRRDSGEVGHLSYLAAQTARRAMTLASQRAADGPMKPDMKH